MESAGIGRETAIFPDQLAPVVRVARDDAWFMEATRWGFPPPPNLGTRPVTDVRNVASPYWRGWLKPEFRCLGPATSFCDYTDSQPRVPHWFALGPDRAQQGEHPLFAFLRHRAERAGPANPRKAMSVS